MNNITKFKSVSMEGFGTFIEKRTFPLDRKGVYLVRGLNGAGKTTVFSALVWCLYKINLKGTSVSSVVTWEENRTKEWKGTRVMVDFEHSGTVYRVVRHIKFKGTTLGVKGDNSLMILVRDAENEAVEWQFLGTEQHKGDMEAYIASLIGVDAKAFCNSIIFGQRMDRLVDSTSDEKRKLFDELFDLEFIEKAKTKAQGDLDKKYAQEAELIMEMRQHEAAITTREENIITERRIHKELAEKKNDKLAALKEHVEKWEEYVKDTKEELAALEKETPDKTDEIAKLSKESSVADDAYMKQSSVVHTLETKLRSLESDDYVVVAALRKGILEVSETITNQSNAIGKDDKEIQQLNTDEEKDKREEQRVQQLIDKYEDDLKNVDTKCKYCDAKLNKEKIAASKDKIQKMIDDEKFVLAELIKGRGRRDYVKLVKELNERKEKRQKVLDGETEKLGKLTMELDVFTDVSRHLQEKNSIRKAKEKLDELKTEKDAVADLLTNLLTEQESKAKEKQEIEKLRAELLEGEEEVKLGKRDYNMLYEEKVSYETKEEEWGQEIHELRIKIGVVEGKLVTVRDWIEKAVWWIKVAFSSGGLKAFVFNAMLNKLNLYVEKYSDVLGVRVKFSVDLSKASKPFTTKCYVDGLEKDYDDFSGGEKQRVDICLAFAMYDLVGHKVHTNILVMDELAEGLDDEGIDTAFSIIRTKAEQGVCVYVITHSNYIDSMYVKYIDITKDENKQSNITG